MPAALKSPSHGVVAREITLDQLHHAAARLAALATEMAEIDLVILGAADRERQIDAQAAILGVDLVRRCAIDAIELLLNLVHLVDVPLYSS
jgi:hypothetical protein